MYSGICICVFLAVLSASSFGQQTLGSHNGNPLAAELEQSLTEHHRYVRAPSSAAGPLKPVPRLDGGIDQRANIGALLAKYLQQARKVTEHDDVKREDDNPFFTNYSANSVCLFAALSKEDRKGPTGRLSVMGNRVQTIDPTHRINDRDYMGWMDFGRRSAEEYEYSS